MNIQGPCYQVCPILAIFKLIMNPYCTKYPTNFGIISNISYISNTISYASMYDPRTCLWDTRYVSSKIFEKGISGKIKGSFKDV